MNVLMQLNRVFSPRGYIHLGKEYFLKLSSFKRCRLTPTLFVVGAQKCGTSSLHAYLDEHPEIFMSKPLKEPGYYVPWTVIQSYYKARNRLFQNKSDLLIRGILNGYKGQKYIGESSTFYTNGEWNISQTDWENNSMDSGAIKLIYIMKNPIERLISHYLHVCRNANYSGDFNEFISDNKEALLISSYGHQINSYLSYLSKEQLLLLNFESFINEPQQTLDSVWQFLRLDGHRIKNTYKQNASPRSQAELREAIRIKPITYEAIRSALDADRKLLETFASPDLIDWDYSNRYAF